MKEKLKAYCLEELQNIRRGWDGQRAISRAYGAMMFYTNYTDESEEDKNEIRTWWDEKMLYSMLEEKVRQEKQRKVKK